MKITIEAEAKEITKLISELQGQPKEKVVEMELFPPKGTLTRSFLDELNNEK